MKARRLAQITTAALVAALSSPAPGHAAVSVLTYQYDNTRAGANTNETTLTPANVNTNTFGRLFQYAVDGYVYGQPLVAANVTIPGRGTHNVLYIVTEHDTVYAFDADANVSTPYWTNSFINLPNTNTVQTPADLPRNNITPEIGITGTPVIDPVSQTIYVEARTKVTSGGSTTFLHSLHALDITTGAERANSPVVIFATNYPGTGSGTNGLINGVVQTDSDGAGHVLWNPLIEQNRAGLLLLNGKVYVTYAEPGDQVPWHGWIFSYDATTLAQTSVYCTTPNGQAGGFWMAGGAPAADSNGNIFANTGNGDLNTANDNYGDCYVRLSTSAGIQLADYFAPNNQLFLESRDLDVGCGGLMLLPDAAGSASHPHLMFGGSKNNVMFLLDRDNLGQFNAANDNQIVQGLTNLLAGMIFAGPAYFNGSIYMVGNNDRVKAFSIANASINTTPVSSATSTPTFSKGTTPTISANGTGNGIVWALNIDQYSSSGAAVLYALNAANLSQQLYSSSQISARDAAGPAVHFTIPSVANGKVYVPGQKKVSVYGSAYFFPAVGAGILSNGVFTLPMAGTPGLTYTLQATTDFSSWVNVSSNTPSSSPFNLIDVNASNFPNRFYRAVVP